MEFEFDCGEILGANSDGIAVIKGTSSSKKGPQHYSAGAQVHPYQKLLNEMVDSLGEASAKAQSLPVSVTNSKRFFMGDDRLYLLTYQYKVYGMLKIGNKKLFIRDEIGNVKEIEPLWVLDFYVHETCQREGYGKFLFEFMLDNEQVQPHKLGYDRPSSKLIKFLKKHYGLENYVPQVNNFVVYNSYFIMDKSFKWYTMDPIKPRVKTSSQPPIAADSSKYQDEETAEDYQNYGFKNQDYVPKSSMPSYGEIKRLQKETYGSGKNEKADQYREREQQDLYNTQNQRKVHFSEENPDVYNIPESGYYGQDYEENQNYEAKGGYRSYQEYDDYQVPAGRNYTDPNIEKNQYERKFNRSTAQFASKDTAKDLFTHPESESPLDTVNPRQQKIPIEYEVKKTDMKIADTESELK